jgi:carbon-monoxide dehydrogenase medium subunit/xanthine dehydrogenase FAD-binding subunit
VVAQSIGGRREIPASEFLLAPYRTALRADEIVTEVAFRGLGGGERGSFIKLGRRNALSVARMSVAVVLGRGGDGVVRRARIAAGSVVPVARRFPEAEACLDGSRGEEEAVREAARSLAAAMVAETGRRWSTPYKEPVVQALARRAIRAALAGEAHA